MNLVAIYTTSKSVLRLIITAVVCCSISLGYSAMDFSFGQHAQCIETDLIVEFEPLEFRISFLERLPSALLMVDADFDDDNDMIFDTLEKLYTSHDATYCRISEYRRVYECLSEQNIELGSHDDIRANAEYNRKIFNRRAMSSVAFIKSETTSSNRGYEKGYEENQFSNHFAGDFTDKDNNICSVEGYRMNRKTDLRIAQDLSVLTLEKFQICR